MHLRQTHFNINFRSTPGSPKCQATFHWRFRINVSQACTILIVPIRATCAAHNGHEDSWPRSPRGTCSSHSRHLCPPTWFPKKHQPFSADGAEQITIGSPDLERDCLSRSGRSAVVEWGSATSEGTGCLVEWLDKDSESCGCLRPDLL